MKLLYAEDTADLNRAVTAVLTMNGYDVTSVFDGREALAKLEADAFDAVILDIMMPGLDGIGVLTEMRRRRIFAPVLLLTAKGEVDDRVSGLDAGADDYLVKPFAMKELLARVRSMTRRGTEYLGDDMTVGDVALRAGTFELSCRNTVRLSVKEFALMQVFAASVDRPLETGYLIERVWHDAPEADADTVWLYVSYLRGKLRAVGSRLSVEGARGGAYTLVSA